MKFSFSPIDCRTLVCSSKQAGVIFKLNNAPEFYNRDQIFDDDAFLFDGYSHWYRSGDNPFTTAENFTVSTAFFPITFSAHSDGLFSCYDAVERKGIEVFVERGGLVTVNLGFLYFSGIRAKVRAGMWNVVTVVCRGYAGWCDIYINGELAGRKQYRRHTPITFPRQSLYIGRRMDNIGFKEELPFGCFYGFMKWMEFSADCPKEPEILALHHSVFTGIQDPLLFEKGMPRRESYAADVNRPQYHLSPPGKWMNEPHAPFYYSGYYHIFYQGNPHAPIWDHLCWGHLRSRDMVRWEDCLPALIPEKESVSPHGCWSGSAVIDKEGHPRLYYTAGDDNRFPNQAVALAMPVNLSDEKLTEWYSLPELVQEQDYGWMGEFRDPFVWREEDCYYMLVGSGDADNGGGNAVIYSSSDGIDWENHGFLAEYDFAKNQELGHVWELPVMLPMRDESGEVVCHILLMCACQIEGDIVETYYFLGHWDPVSCHFTPSHEKAMLLDLGKGTFTGPSGFVTPDHRSVLFTIAQGRRRFMEEIHAGWAHNGGMPVELSMRDGRVEIQPVREVYSLFEEECFSLESADGALIDSANANLVQSGGDRRLLDLTVDGDEADLILHYGEKLWKICYSRTEQRISIFDENDSPCERYRGEIDNVSIDSEPIHFAALLDYSMLELYLNGRKSVTLRNYIEEGESRFFEIDNHAHPFRLVLK